MTLIFLFRVKTQNYSSVSTLIFPFSLKALKLLVFLSGGCRHLQTWARHHEELRTCNDQLLIFQTRGVFFFFFLAAFVGTICPPSGPRVWRNAPWNESFSASGTGHRSLPQVRGRPKPQITQQAAWKLKDLELFHSTPIFFFFFAYLCSCRSRVLSRTAHLEL